MEIQQAITTFLSAPAFAVAGASKNRSKYGNKILRCYLQNGRTAFPINPGCSDVEGHKCYTSISSSRTDRVAFDHHLTRCHRTSRRRGYQVVCPQHMDAAGRHARWRYPKSRRCRPECDCGWSLCVGRSGISRGSLEALTNVYG